MFIRQSANGNWYVCRRTQTGRKNPNGKSSHRDWFLVKYHGRRNTACIYAGEVIIILPKSFIGKRVRLKVEVIESKAKEDDKVVITNE